MNICFVNSTHKWGGVKTWTLDVAKYLQHRGHDVHIFARKGPFLEKASSCGLHTKDIIFGPDCNPLLIMFFLRYFHKHSINCVCVNVGKDMRTAGIAARILNIPVVHRVGLGADMENSAKVRFFHKWITPTILVPCQQIKSELCVRLPFIKKNDVRVILNTKAISPELLCGMHKPLRLISTSQLTRDKGHKDVLSAIQLLLQQGCLVEYHVVGTGPEEKHLQELAEKLGIAAQVRWLGFQKDVRAYLRGADVFVLPSYREGLPNALLEAMAEGLPCVARNTGGVSEIWPEKCQNWLLDRSDGPEKFVQVLRILSEYSEEQLCASGRIFWERLRCYPPSQMIDDLERLFISLFQS